MNEITKSARRTVRRAAIGALGTGPGRATARMLTRQRYARTLPMPIQRALDVALTLQQTSRAERLAGVDALVELFFDLCELDEIDTFVEAGAKEGTASRRAVDLGCERVVAFEANPHTHARFAKRFDDSPAQYVHVALTDSPGPVTFMVRRHDDGTPIPDGQGSLLIRPDHTPGYEQVTVEGVRLDDHLTYDLGLPPAERAAMWIDVEGAVDKVVAGAPELLATCDVVLVEVEERAAWEGQAWLQRDVTAALSAHGLVPVGRDAQSRFQYNTLYVRASRCTEEAIASRLREWRRSEAEIVDPQ